MRNRLVPFKYLLAAPLLVLAVLPLQAHPMDPLNADEIIGAAQILLQGGAAQTGAIFQSVELREPAKHEVLGTHRGGAAPSREATVFYRQNRQNLPDPLEVAGHPNSQSLDLPNSGIQF